ncbi:hypothetical protein I5U59_09670 [Stenotrophomonas maltophilia]|uniref:hypothetical protein n=1 Tax=Bacteria TaxID=2 RepID=UPI001310D1B7|nr:hypothetical protein [Stenotrophomonas maltophilia]MBH1477359.1 hypothetical protein [Stenotrophomonas maltophilia]MBH1503342.1 hypothetical protein [Stenotrophomonas maltophilia]MBH1784032.1 hypothetical protein [Stenotrophomonas maltophilia]
MSAMKITRKELQRMQFLARMCEVHQRDAARCADQRMPGAKFAHDSIARDYSREAFELSCQVALRNNT